MRFRPALALLLIMIFCFCSACCGKTDETPAEIAETASSETGLADGAMSIAYSGTDTLDPYTAVTKYNKELCSLIYDSLVVIDENYSPVYHIAASADVKGTSCTVTLKSAVFSDGTVISGNDVAYSFKKAQKSSTRYETQLKTVKSCTVSGNTVTFTLSNSDPYAVNLLDFPILKEGSDLLTNDDGKVLPPVGSGRYVFDSTKKELTANEKYVGGAMSLKTIQLINTPDDESHEHNIEVGNIGFSYSDMSDNTPIKMTGKSISVELNNLVYLGLNFGNGYLSEPRFRQAISLALNRKKLASSAYSDYATPAKGPFPASWKAAAGMQTMSEAPEISRAVALLNEIGYNTKDEEGYFTGYSGKRITLSLLCNLDNTARVAAAELIKAQLAEIGIDVSVRTVNWDAYSAELTAGSFDMYIGEVKLMNNMNLSPLVTLKSGACFGYIKTNRTSAASASSTSSSSATSSAAYVTVSAYDMINDMYSGKATLTDVISAFNSELPVIPLCHRMGQVSYTSAVTSGLKPNANDLFNGIENISFN